MSESNTPSTSNGGNTPQVVTSPQETPIPVTLSPVTVKVDNDVLGTSAAANALQDAMVCSTLFLSFILSFMPLFQHHPTHSPKPSMGNPIVEQLDRRDTITQRIRDCESDLGALRNELEQTDMVIQSLHGADAAMQRFWQTVKLPPVSLVDPKDVAHYPDSDSDANSLEPVAST
jgi:hypothetical protein